MQSNDIVKQRKSVTKHGDENMVELFTAQGAMRGEKNKISVFTVSWNTSCFAYQVENYTYSTNLSFRSHSRRLKSRYAENRPRSFSLLLANNFLA